MPTSLFQQLREAVERNTPPDLPEYHLVVTTTIDGQVFEMRDGELIPWEPPEEATVATITPHATPRIEIEFVRSAHAPETSPEDDWHYADP